MISVRKGLLLHRSSKGSLTRRAIWELGNRSRKRCTAGMLMTQSPTQLGARIRRCRESVETNSVDGIVKVFGALDDLDFDAEEINGDVYPVELGETHGIFFRGNDRLGLTFLAAIDHVQQFLLRVSMVIGVLLAVHHLGSLSSQTLL